MGVKTPKYSEFIVDGQKYASVNECGLFHKNGFVSPMCKTSGFSV